MTKIMLALALLTLAACGDSSDPIYLRCEGEGRFPTVLIKQHGERLTLRNSQGGAAITAYAIPITLMNAEVIKAARTVKGRGSWEVDIGRVTGRTSIIHTSAVGFPKTVSYTFQCGEFTSAD